MTYGQVPTAFFDRTYDEAMVLLREARDYNLQRVPSERDRLGPEDRLRLACETMRVTTRLGQVMAWLLAQKAVHAGEMSRQDMTAAEHRLAARAVCLNDRPELSAGLPPGLQSLLERSHDLYVRVLRLDEDSARPPSDLNPFDISSQL